MFGRRRGAGGPDLPEVVWQGQDPQALVGDPEFVEETLRRAVEAVSIGNGKPDLAQASFGRFDELVGSFLLGYGMVQHQGLLQAKIVTYRLAKSSVDVAVDPVAGLPYLQTLTEAHGRLPAADAVGLEAFGAVESAISQAGSERDRASMDLVSDAIQHFLAPGGDEIAGSGHFTVAVRMIPMCLGIAASREPSVLDLLS